MFLSVWLAGRSFLESHQIPEPRYLFPHRLRSRVSSDTLATQAMRADAAGLIHMAEQRASVRSAEPEPVSNCLPCPVWHIYQSVVAALATEDSEFVQVLEV